MIRRLRIVAVFGVLAMALAACGSAGGNTSTGSGGLSINLGQRSAQAIALQGSDVAGLSRCSQSGNPDAVVRTLQAASASGAVQLINPDDLAGSWKDAKTGGAHDGYVVAYASASDCEQFVFGSAPAAQGDIVFNYVLVFSDASQSQAAWNAGVFGGHPPGYYQSAYGATVGKSTGLGDNAFTYSVSGFWVAYWAKGSSYSFLVTNYGPLAAQQIANKVAARM